ncbi:MAG: PHB depolymerase family esterase [Myxococcota bacterium]
MQKFLLVLLVAGCKTSAAPVDRPDCGGPDNLCQVDGGQYLAVLPSDWDGQEQLPTFVHFHGYGGTAVELYNKGSFTDPMGEVRALAIYPDGKNNTWAHSGSPSSARDELPYFDAVLADARERFPVDDERLIVSGFSQGGSMAWDVACNRGNSIGAVYAPVSGAFWTPLPESCPGGPIRLRHEHGTNDRIFPLGGRAIGSFRQGDARDSIEVVTRTSGCTGDAEIVEEDGRTCQVWNNCSAGGEVLLCLHGGDHRVTSGWHRRTLEWAFPESK